MVDQKQELLRTIKVKNLRGYHFSFKEDGNQAVASMTNSAVQKLINLDRASKGLTLSYTKVKNKKKKTTRTFKCEVKTDESSVTILVRDLITNRMISKNLFPPLQRRTMIRNFKLLNNAYKTSAVNTEVNYSARQTELANRSLRHLPVA